MNDNKKPRNGVKYSQRELAADVASKITFTPTDDRLLVKPLKPIMVTKDVPVIEKAPKSLEEAEQTEAKFEKRKVEANMQKAIIIKMGPDYSREGSIPAPYGVGDVVIYPRGGGQACELLKDSRFLRRYEVVAYELSN